MQTPEQNLGSSRQGDFPLTRRLVLRFRYARPGATAGQNQVITQIENLVRNGLKRWQRAARFRRTLVVVKWQDLVQPTSLERGSAATRTVVRSISWSASSNELTHISRINRR
jgi:hypothetical protein